MSPCPSAWPSLCLPLTRAAPSPPSRLLTQPPPHSHPIFSLLSPDPSSPRGQTQGDLAKPPAGGEGKLSGTPAPVLRLGRAGFKAAGCHQPWVPWASLSSYLPVQQGAQGAMLGKGAMPRCEPQDRFTPPVTPAEGAGSWEQGCWLCVGPGTWPEVWDGEGG